MKHPKEEKKEEEEWEEGDFRTFNFKQNKEEGEWKKRRGKEQTALSTR